MLKSRYKDLHHFKKNNDGKDFVVGDIHGAYDSLFYALNSMHFNFDNDRLFSVGDLIDRGPDSEKCLSLCYEPWFFAVRGNHEQIAFDGLLRRSEASYYCWLQNGGSWFLGRESDELLAVFQDLDSRLPYGIEVETDEGLIGIVHADVSNSVWANNFIDANDKIKQEIIWSRSRISSSSKGFSDVIGVNKLYVGHTPVEEITRKNNVYYIDTNAYRTGNFEIVKISG